MPGFSGRRERERDPGKLPKLAIPNLHVCYRNNRDLPKQKRAFWCNSSKTWKLHSLVYCIWNYACIKHSNAYQKPGAFWGRCGKKGPILRYTGRLCWHLVYRLRFSGLDHSFPDQWFGSEWRGPFWAEKLSPLYLPSRSTLLPNYPCTSGGTESEGIKVSLNFVTRRDDEKSRGEKKGAGGLGRDEGWERGRTKHPKETPFHSQPRLETCFSLDDLIFLWFRYLNRNHNFLLFCIVSILSHYRFSFPPVSKTVTRFVIRPSHSIGQFHDSTFQFPFRFFRSSDAH